MIKRCFLGVFWAVLLFCSGCNNARPPISKIYTNWSELKDKLDKHREKKIVFTGGTFDIVHYGHVHVLCEAKKQGDILVVAINTDESVKRYKGPERPINPVMQRAIVVAAFQMVDYVVIFPQDTPLELIRYFKPAIFVKGGDYKKEKVAGYQYMKEYGGNVVITDYIKDISTTSIIKAIKKE